jgi:hypothetical protein
MAAYMSPRLLATNFENLMSLANAPIFAWILSTRDDGNSQVAVFTNIGGLEALAKKFRKDIMKVSLDSGYMFSPENQKRAFSEGIESLSIDVPSGYHLSAYAFRD